MTDQSINIIQNLDGDDKVVTVNDVDTAILKDAKKYNIDLEKLENPITVQKPLPVMEKRRAETWRRLDVNLSDVVNLMIATSERPTFLIRDDKLVYINQAAIKMLELESDRDVVGKNFLNLVVPEEWNMLAENIGEMLTNGKIIRIHFKNASGVTKAMNFQAIYLSEIEHFSFILLGEHVKKEEKISVNNLYDDLTGLPNFFLFEDRVQVAVSMENIKDNAKDQKMIAVAAISINNMESFRRMHIEDFVVKKIANNLVLNLNKMTTVALGVKYNFWIMLQGVKNQAEINHEIRHVFEILNDGISDNFTRHELSFSIGVACFPQSAHSAKKLIEQAISAVKNAQRSNKNSIEFFESKNN